MGMINLGSSMRYGPTGKKRKNHLWSATKAKRVVPHTMGKYKPSTETIQRLQAMKDFDKKYPSYTGESKYTPVADESYKKDVSKNFTVAIGYNKGGYQVIPNNEIKHIGK